MPTPMAGEIRLIRLQQMLLTRSAVEICADLTHWRAGETWKHRCLIESNRLAISRAFKQLA
jgi:hypothetical protein